jgi:hypothetical protein
MIVPNSCNGLSSRVNGACSGPSGRSSHARPDVSSIVESIASRADLPAHTTN